jgi:hypothetical protein
MMIKPGDVFEAILKRADADGEAKHRERFDGYRITILRVSGEKVVYQRAGNAASETTLFILQDAIHRGDLVRSTDESTC